LSRQPRERSAVALRYRVGKDRAPIVVAKGKGKTAERIIALAEEHQIPLYEDEGLTALLMKLEPESMIPPELYRVVAEVLSLVYRLENRAESLQWKRLLKLRGEVGWIALLFDRLRNWENNQRRWRLVT